MGSISKEIDLHKILEVYSALKDQDGGHVGQFEHTVYVAEGGAEILSVS